MLGPGNTNDFTGGKLPVFEGVEGVALSRKTPLLDIPMPAHRVAVLYKKHM